ncbi:dehydrogenase [Erythrobacter sp. SG61-1L]|uniref:D-2-hydroxyacid dehydrogenase n=1 Tax=Erythrobacter sp. SG61-1L TaxID=1603897 RepID=UPI0006C907F9|nr:D-2-hydroxyacid dehydrogenase [Erythrobacter sp. SG61-1L]KPL67122.1 dehydrogenase [Erythrobacter sp. SG61-1L]
MTIAVLPGLARPMLEARLPDWIEPRWWHSVEQLHALAPEAEIGWFDMHYKPPLLEAVALAKGLKWLNSVYAGLDFLPMDEMRERGVQLTNGTGLTDIQVSEFAVLGMLAIAKNYAAIVRAQDRHEWLSAAPGIRDLAGSRALILGYGAIGRKIGEKLAGFGVEVVPVRRHAAEGVLTPDQWRARIGEFDWIVLTVPGTPETEGMIGAAEIAAMKPEAVLVNFARANVVDQEALVAALKDRRIFAAMLDVTDPEPLPADHVLWDLDNAHITMHLSGIPTPQSMLRGAIRFVENCERYRKGEPLEPRFDPVLGY